MKLISAVFFVLALALALLFGAQTASWSWGPGLLGLGVASLFGVFGSRQRCHLPLAVALLAAAGWIILRCYQSEVLDGARADALLVIALLASCWLVAGYGGNKKALTLLYDGIALTVVANAVMAFLQWRDPSFCWPYEARPREQLSGFFGHYNYFSNYLLGTGGILLGKAVFGSDVKGRRLGYLIVVVGAFALIPLSGSRGGVLALGIGLLVFATAVALILYRRKNRWFPLAAAIVPFGLVAGAGVAWIVLSGIQSDRQQEQGIANLADGGSRLEWIGLALATSRDHLWQGGGSRSYSWERNGKWDPDEFGWAHENEPFVHNELLQAITDYGVIGAGLVMVVLGLAIWRCLAGLVLDSPLEKSDTLVESDSDAVHAGVLTAGAAMVTQANLSFVFHFIPLVMLFGMLLGLILPRRAKGSASGFMRYPVGIGLGLILLWAGSKATYALERLWPVVYVLDDREKMSTEEAFARFDAAGDAWPGFEIAEESGKLFLILAAREGITEEASARLRHQSIL
ncbi:O-antigen ligase family protein, partial [Haloferula sp.]|uniref:O-antigen ligase family protein n=1 Tax=Haloferula sp. TaxID=2497595 RepID=UPI003C73F16E